MKNNRLALKFLLSMCFLLILSVLVSCDKDNIDKNKQEESTKNKQEKNISNEENTINETIANTYNDILDNVLSYKFDETENTNSIYKYALINIEGNKIPVLLINKSNGDGIETIKIFYYNFKNKNIETPKEVFPIGVASVGGFRGGISISKADNTLRYTTVLSGTGEMNVEKLEFKEDILSREFLEKGNILNLSNKEREETIEIIWTDIENREPLKQAFSKNFKGINNNSSNKIENSSNDSITNEKIKDNNQIPQEKIEGKKEENDLESLIEHKKNEGKIIVQGTIRRLTYNEILDLQGIQDPNPGNKIGNQIYHILILSSPQTMDLKSAGGGTRSDKVDIIDLLEFNLESNEDIVTVSLDPSQMFWPSDTGLPLGQPRAQSYEILN